MEREALCFSGQPPEPGAWVGLGSAWVRGPALGGSCPREEVSLREDTRRSSDRLKPDLEERLVQGKDKMEEPVDLGGAEVRSEYT